MTSSAAFPVVPRTFTSVMSLVWALDGWLCLGNISTSEIEYESKSTQLNSQTRYPLNGQWKTEFYFGYIVRFLVNSVDTTCPFRREFPTRRARSISWRFLLAQPSQRDRLMSWLFVWFSLNVFRTLNTLFLKVFRSWTRLSGMLRRLLVNAV